MKHRLTQRAVLMLAICGASLPATAGHVAAQARKRPTPAVRPGAISLAALAGRWKVVGVLVEDADVQALVENDPSYMGAVLNVTPQKLSWQPHKGGELSEVCVQPRLAANGLISCGTGEFGPPDTKLVVDKQNLKLEWYDGGTLVLRRLR